MARIAWLDAAKGIGITLVVVYHTLEGVLNSYSNSPIWVEWFASYFSLWLMPMFFMVSGILARHTIEFSALKQITPKVINWFYIYVLWSFIIYLVRLVLGGITNTQISGDEIFKILWNPVPTIWFIYALLLSFILTWVLRRFDGRIVFVCAIIINICNAYLGGWLSETIFERLAWIYPFYVMGYFFSGMIYRVVEKHETFKVSIFMFTFLSLALLINPFQIPIVMLPLMSILMSILFLQVCVAFSNAKKVGAMFNGFVYLGSISLFIYLTHFPIPAASRLLLQSFGVNAPLVIVLLAIILSLITGHWAKKISITRNGKFFFYIPKRFLN